MLALSAKRIYTSGKIMKARIYLLLIIGSLAGLHPADAQTSFILSTNYAVTPGGTNAFNNTNNTSTPYSVTPFMNVDGRVDLVTANYNFNTLTVLTNDGTGNFTSNTTYTVGSEPDSVAAADVNGDGFADLICANQGDGTLMVLTNDGSGGFASNATYSAGIGPFSVVTADINNDGYEDLICANSSGIDVLTNNGSGGFTLSSSINGGVSDYQSVATADVNKDGNLDLILAIHHIPSSLAVFTNNGSGSFQLSHYITVGNGPASVTTADVNLDRQMDLICANKTSGSVTVLTNNGSGGFVTSSNLISAGLNNGCDFVTAVDVNGDGKIDLICANAGFFPSFPNTSSLTVFTNNGSGGFAIATNVPMSSSGANWIAAADFNGDGKVDFACANRDSNSVSVFFNTSTFPPPTSTPSLAIKPSGKGISVSWPLASAGWSLQQNSDLTTPNWGPSGSSGYTISDDGTNKSLVIPSPPGNLFFRLLHP
jgi:hypothetical protein